MPVTTLSTEIDGRTLTIETGKLAMLAGGSVTVRYGDTMLLGTANRSEPRPGLDFFPLTVEFEERMYAAGKIPGGFIKRESRPSEGGDPGRPPDGPAHPPAVPRGLQGRRPGGPHCPVDRPGERSGRHRHHRRVGRADDQRDPVQRPRRCRAHRPHQRRVRDQSHRQPARGVGARPHRLRHARRDHDGRGRRQDRDRGRHGRGDHVRPPRPGARSSTSRSSCASRSARPSACRTSSPASSRSSSSSRRSNPNKTFVVFDVETTSRDVKQGAIVEIGAVKVKQGQDRRPLVDPRQPGHADHRPPAARHHGRGRQGRAVARRGRPDSSWTGRATRCSSATTSASTSASSRRRSGHGQHIEAGRYLDTLVLAREAYPDTDLKLGDLARFFELEVEPNHRALPDAEATAQLLIRLATDLPERIDTFKRTVADAIRASRGAAPTRRRHTG